MREQPRGEKAHSNATLSDSDAFVWKCDTERRVLRVSVSSWSRGSTDAPCEAAPAFVADGSVRLWVQWVDTLPNAWFVRRGSHGQRVVWAGRGLFVAVKNKGH